MLELSLGPPHRHHFPPPLSIRGEECQSFARLLFCHYLPITTVHVLRNKILCFCVDVLYCVITTRYWEGKWAGDLIQFSIGHTQPPLVLVPWHILLMWFCSLNHQWSPWSVLLFHHTIFIQPLHQISHRLRLMRTAPRWFTADR